MIAEEARLRAEQEIREREERERQEQEERRKLEEQVHGPSHFHMTFRTFWIFVVNKAT